MKLEGLEIKIDFIASSEMEKALGRFAASAESLHDEEELVRYLLLAASISFELLRKIRSKEFVDKFLRDTLDGENDMLKTTSKRTSENLQ